MSDIIRSEADHTKEGPSADELLEKSKQEYMGMWTHISELSPADSKKIVNGIQQQVFLTSEKSEFIQYMKSPTPYIAMAIGVVVPILCILLFLWYSLLLE